MGEFLSFQTKAIENLATGQIIAVDQLKPREATIDGKIETVPRCWFGQAYAITTFDDSFLCWWQGYRIPG